MTSTKHESEQAITSKSLHKKHTAILQAEAKGEYTKALVVDLSRLVAKATEYAASLEKQLEDAASSPAEFLSRHRMVSHIWGLEDVRNVCPDLTDDQAWAVLQAVDKNLDSEVGITWETLEEMA